jgi:hypothetical protein
MKDNVPKRAFALFGVGSPYKESARILADYLLKYTIYDVVLYYNDLPTFKPSASPRLKTINIKDLNLNFDITKFPNSLNPNIIKSTLENYDEVVYLDSDIQITPYINDIFKETDKITNYPLTCRYPFWYMHYDYNGKSYNWVGDDIKQTIPYDYQFTPVLQVCCSLSNKKCIPFIQEWIDFTDLITHRNLYSGLNHEEGIFNALMWNKKNTHYLPHRISWSYHPGFISHAVDIWTTPENYLRNINGNDENMNSFFIPQKYSHSLTFLPPKKEEFWGVHCIKSLHSINQTFDLIEEYF